MKWKPIANYEGLYEVSDEGNVRSLDRYRKSNIRHVTKTFISGKELKQNLKRNGYRTVDLCKDGKVKTTLVHRIVADAFLPNPQNLRFVNHKDSNRENNRVENLEWVTSSENRTHGISNGNVTFSSKPVFCEETGQVFSRPQLAAEWIASKYPERINGTIRVAAHNIGSACKGRTPRAYGFTWKYYEGSTTIPKGSRGKRPEMGDPSKNEGEDIV